MSLRVTWPFDGLIGLTPRWAVYFSQYPDFGDGWLRRQIGIGPLFVAWSARRG